MYSEQIKAEHRRNIREANAALREAGVCIMWTVHRDQPAPAAYVWHGESNWGVGPELPLCARCCASWRARVATGDLDPPERITVF